MTTIKDLASVLNVSPSTISKAMSDSPEISVKTKRRVREAAEALGYVPNHYARSLKSKMTKTIGVVVPNVIDDFFAKVLHGIEKEASKHGFTVLITFSNDSKKSEHKNLLGLIRHSVDGILISFSKETQKSGDYGDMQSLVTYGMPIVMFDRVNKQLPFDSVAIDDFDGAYQATKYLLDSGCKNIALVSPISNTSVGQSRKDGYIRALRDCKESRLRPLHIDIVHYNSFREQLSKILGEHMLDGILAADEMSAIYALNVVQKYGYRIPWDLSVIGFTNGPMAETSNPSLTVVSQHAEKIGRKSFQLLRRRIVDRKAKVQNVVFHPELFIRESTKLKEDTENQ